MNATLPRRFERYVAIGDSSTEGVDDPDGHGGYRGWSRRLAQRLADAQGSIAYANFGVYGRTTRQILRTQLDPALALGPDLATVFSGTNDVLRPRFDAESVARDMAEIQGALTAAGATVLTFTLPDLTPLMPIARALAPRIRALNQALRDSATRSGAVVIDFAAYPVGTDSRLWSPDRIHANALGHARIADALAHSLRLPGSDDSWSRPLPLWSRTRWEWCVAEWNWSRQYLLPWIGKGLRLLPADPPRARDTPSLHMLEAMPPE